MKFTITSGLVVGAVLFSSPAQAQFGGFNPMGGGGGGATPEKVDAFVADAKAAEILVRTSAWHIAHAVLSKDRYAELQAKREVILKIADPQEKDAKLKELDKTLNDDLAKADYKKASEDEKKADEEHKKQTAAALFNYSLGVLKDAELIIKGKDLVSGTPSPMVATRIPAAKGALDSIVSQADAQTKVIGGIKTLCTSVDLKDLPTKASDQPKPLAD